MNEVILFFVLRFQYFKLIAKQNVSPQSFYNQNGRAENLEKENLDGADEQLIDIFEHIIFIDMTMSMKMLVTCFF